MAWTLEFVFIVFKSSIFTLIVFIITEDHSDLTADNLKRYTILLIAYLMFYNILSIITVLISAHSKTAKEALIKLLGIWLLFVIISPKSLQAVGHYLYPTPSKIEMETIVELELKKLGDSHNPDDPHFKALKDSVLLANKVKNVNDLPFNYSGFVMAQGKN